MPERSGSTLMDGSNRRRWLISAAIVLLLHAGIAVAVLTWRNIMSAPPILIDLAPATSTSGQNEAQATPPVSAAEPITPAPAAAEENRTAGVGPPDNAAPPVSVPSQPMPSDAASPAEQNGENQNVAKAEQGNGPARVTPGIVPPQLPSSPQGTEANIGAGAPAQYGSTPGSPISSSPISNSHAPNSPMANMPLDTSITVQPPVHGNTAVGPFANRATGPLASRETGPLDQKPMSEFRPAKPFGVPDVPRNSALPNNNSFAASSNPSVAGAGARNAPGIGAHVQDRAHAAMARAMNANEAPKNAIGSSGPVVASRSDATGLSGGVTRNAIGVTANFRPRIPRVDAGENKLGVAAATHAMPTAPIINGRGLARSAIGPAMIGGPARQSGAGMLSGSDFHLRHP